MLLAKGPQRSLAYGGADQGEGRVKSLGRPSQHAGALIVILISQKPESPAMTLLCEVCKSEMQPATSGSERRYCSPACKAVGRNERDRITRAIEKYEAEVRDLDDEVRAPHQLCDMHGRSAKDRLANARRHIDALNARLLVLHGADDEDGSTD